MQIQEFEYSVNLLRAVLWQYENATSVISLLTAKQNWYIDNVTTFWENWYNDVFNLQTANDFGCSVWAIILGLPLVINPFPDDPDKPIFGFDGPPAQNFDNGTFTSASNGYTLSLADKRLVLKLRYFQLITRGAIPEINKFLAFAFADYGTVYAMDGLNMTMRYVFLFPIDPLLLNIFTTYDLLPRPSGVLLQIIDGTRLWFGFDGLPAQNFDNGTFLDGYVF
jgi:uncharacterized protein DUF2612